MIFICLFFFAPGCHFDNVKTVLKASRNAGGKLIKNKILCEVILEVNANAKGQIEIEENIILQKDPQNPLTPTMQVDKCKVKTDMSFVVKQYVPFTTNAEDMIQPPGRSRFTKVAKKKLCKTHDGLFKRDPRRAKRYKKCLYCDKMESFENESGELPKKFKYCDVCRACYCSAECQKEDWSVHKSHCW